ncbi:hypothetical protein RRG08_047729 [Elysia crispata]|uniref:Uncharacterized protein n=1 Tax=Elysia crispata TaxID=231223 RepID=A0AAE1A8H0_9GAST|nr:hypothetical protein RRG08_047729 [Elysia crispata]
MSTDKGYLSVPGLRKDGGRGLGYQSHQNKRTEQKRSDCDLQSGISVNRMTPQNPSHDSLGHVWLRTFSTGLCVLHEER